MKVFVFVAVLAACVALLGPSVAAFFMPAVKPAVAAVPTGVEALASPVLRGFKPLSFLLTLLGIPVDHLVDGTQKCVAQLGPDALQAVSALKKLLGALTFIG